MRIVAIRHVGPYMGIGAAFEKLFGAVETHDLTGDVIGVYHDDPRTTPEKDLRADAGVTIESDVSAPDGMHVVDVDGGSYACGVHERHYSSIGDTYQTIMAWVSKQGREVASTPCCEVYLNTPRDTAPDDLRTEVRVPVA